MTDDKLISEYVKYSLGDNEHIYNNYYIRRLKIFEKENDYIDSIYPTSKVALNLVGLYNYISEKREEKIDLLF